MTTIAKVQKGVTASVLAALLALSTFLVFPLDGAVPAARADEVADAQAVLKEATAKLEELQKECDELNATVERLQSQIDATADSALELQETLTLGRNSLGQIANYEYRMGSFDTMVGIFLGATSFQEFTRNMDYLNLLARNQAAELTEQTARKQQYDSTMSLLGAQKDTQEDAMEDLEAKKAEAEKVVAEATAKLQDAEAAQALRTQAQAIANTGSTGSPSAGGSSAPAESGAPSGGSSGGSGDGGGSSSGGGSGGGGGASAPSTAGWQTGGATAYNPTGAATATGAPCTWDSMGVAVCMSMPNYRSYYGRMVEISYNGRSVVATVNDCGGFGAHPWPETMFDLQPGVWKQLGYSSAVQWGRRTISYRFL